MRIIANFENIDEKVKYITVTGNNAEKFMPPR